MQPGRKALQTSSRAGLSGEISLARSGRRQPSFWSNWQAHPEGLANVRPLIAEDLLDAGDRLIDRLLGANALGDDAMDRLPPDRLVDDLVVPQIARGDGVVVSQPAGLGLHHRGHVVLVARVEPERLGGKGRGRWQHSPAG